MHTLTLTELSAQLKNKQVSATEMAKHYLDRIATSTLNAFTGVNPELTLEQALQVSKDLRHAIGAVRQWQERASGMNAIRMPASALSTTCWPQVIR